MPDPAQFASLVDADTLSANLDNSAWRVIDCRHDLLHPESGFEAYRQSHLRGAVFAHLDRDLSGTKDGRNGRHPLPSPERLVAQFQRWGVDPHTQIVAYDANGGPFAARLWWLARWLGHEWVAVLDGGWQAALKVGMTVETAVPEYPAGRFARRPARALAVDAEQVAAARSDQRWLIVDARAPDRYAGQNETIDPVGGHIPGAVNRFWQLNLQADGRFKSPGQLRQEFASQLGSRPAARLIAQCGSGVTACHHLVAMQAAGLTGAALYPGSWSQWIADPARPIAVGANP